MCYQNEIKYIKFMLGADSTTGFLLACAYMSSWKQANCSFFNPNIKQIIYPNIKFDKITK
jgi:hypothetical protein